MSAARGAGPPAAADHQDRRLAGRGAHDVSGQDRGHDRPQPQRLLDVDLEYDFVASCDRLDLDRAEQAQGIEPPAILHERDLMEGHTLT